MIRLLIIILSCVWMGGLVYAAQPISVDVSLKGADAIVNIGGEFSSYRALGKYSPARLVVELYGGKTQGTNKRQIPVKGGAINNIELIPTPKGTSVVIYSTDPTKLFRYELSDTQEGLKVNISSQGRPREQFRESPLSLYTGQKITMDFYKTDIHNVMRLFGEIANKNIVLDEKVKGEVTISLKDVPWDQALDMILEANNLVKEEKNGVISIRPLTSEPAGQEGVLAVKPLPKEKAQVYQQWSRERSAEAKIYSLLYRGRVLETEGNHKEAFKNYEEAFRLMRSNERLLEKNLWIFESLCEGAFRMGNLEKAFHYAKEALKFRGEDPWAAHVAAITAAMMGKQAEATFYFDLSMSQGEPSPELILNYALFLENTGRKEYAIELFQRYEDTVGPDATIGMEIARLLADTGQREKACQKYKEILNYSTAEERGLKGTIAEKMKLLCREGMTR